MRVSHSAALASWPARPESALTVIAPIDGDHVGKARAEKVYNFVMRNLVAGLHWGGHASWTKGRELKASRAAVPGNGTTVTEGRHTLSPDAGNGDEQWPTLFATLGGV